MGKRLRGEEPGDLLHVRRKEDGKSSQHKDLLVWTEPEPEDVDESCIGIGAIFCILEFTVQRLYCPLSFSIALFGAIFNAARKMLLGYNPYKNI